MLFNVFINLVLGMYCFLKRIEGEKINKLQMLQKIKFFDQEENK